MYSVAGTITYDSDELVPDASVSVGKHTKTKAASYTEIAVTGEDAQHSTFQPMMRWLPQKEHIESQTDRRAKPDKNKLSGEEGPSYLFLV